MEKIKNKNLPELAVFVSMLGENSTVLKFVQHKQINTNFLPLQIRHTMRHDNANNVNLSLCDLRDLSADSVINSVTLFSFSYHMLILASLLRCGGF